MKKTKYLFASTILMLFSVVGCEKDLNKNPLGTQTEQNFFLDPDQAILGINAVYDVTSWDEGPNGASHVYEWMFGDVLSNDAEKGSTPGDFPSIQKMKEWITDPNDNPANSIYRNNFQGIFRSNTVIKNLDVATWDPTLKNRIMGEAYFLRSYFYFYMLKLYGGMPIFAEPVKPSQFGTTPRASFAETAKFIEDGFQKAIDLLPVKSAYSSQDLGRATKGTAQAYLARLIMYQIGTDNTNSHTWNEVYDITKSIINSNQYALISNYAQIYEVEGENSSESIFEIQCKESSSNWGPIKTGTNNNIIQNSRKLWGWGFNNPTLSLVNEFEANDPRKACTVYGNGDIVLGIKQEINLNENYTGYLNRKAAILKPTEPKASGQNIRKFRYADVMLMNAEAAAHISGKEGEAITILNKIRDRARMATKPKGSKEGDATTYQPASTPSSALPQIDPSLKGQPLLDAIYHERRVELGMEALHFWDMVRTGKYLSSLSATVQTACESHCIKTGVVNPIPVLPLPATEVQSWGLAQNPNY